MEQLLGKCRALIRTAVIPIGLGFVLGVIFSLLAASWPWCGPMSACGFAGWLYDYQTVVAGILALLAGYFAFWGVIAQIKENRRIRTEEQQAAVADYDKRQKALGFSMAMDALAKMVALWSVLVKVRDASDGLTAKRARNENTSDLVENLRVVLVPELDRSLNTCGVTVARIYSTLTNSDPTYTKPIWLSITTGEAAFLGARQAKDHAVQKAAAGEPLSKEGRDSIERCIARLDESMKVLGAIVESNGDSKTEKVSKMLSASKDLASLSERM